MTLLGDDRFGSKGDIPVPLAHFRFTPTKQTSTVYEYPRRLDDHQRTADRMARAAAASPRVLGATRAAVQAARCRQAGLARDCRCARYDRGPEIPNESLLLPRAYPVARTVT